MKVEVEVVQIEVIGHAPKQKKIILEMIKEFALTIPDKISVGGVKVREVKKARSRKNA